MAQKLTKPPIFFYVCISALQLYSNGDLLPKRLKGAYTPVSKTICLTEAQTKKTHSKS